MFDDGIKLQHDSNTNSSNTNVIKDIYTPSTNFIIISHKLNEIKEHYKQTTHLRNYMYIYVYIFIFRLETIITYSKTI